MWCLPYRNAGFLIKTPPDSINWSRGSTNTWIQGTTHCQNRSSSRKNSGWLKPSHSSHLFCHQEPSTTLILARTTELPISSRGKTQYPQTELSASGLPLPLPLAMSRVHQKHTEHLYFRLPESLPSTSTSRKPFSCNPSVSNKQAAL